MRTIFPRGINKSRLGFCSPPPNKSCTHTHTHMMGSVSIHHTVGGKPTIPCTIKAVWGTHTWWCLALWLCNKPHSCKPRGWPRRWPDDGDKGCLTNCPTEEWPHRAGMVGRGRRPLCGLLGVPTCGRAACPLGAAASQPRGGLRPSQGG